VKETLGRPPLLLDEQEQEREQRETMKGNALGLNGMPPLFDFQLASLDTGMEDFGFMNAVKRYPPPKPPAGWAPAPLPPPLSSSSSSNYREGPLVGSRGAPLVSASETPAARAALEALLFSGAGRKKFVDAAAPEAENQTSSVLGGSVPSSAKQHASMSLSRILVGKCTKVEELWIPPLLLLKRFDVKDPISREARKAWEERGQGSGVGGLRRDSSSMAPGEGGQSSRNPPNPQQLPQQLQQPSVLFPIATPLAQDPTMAPLFIDIDSLLAQAIYGRAPGGR